MDCSTFTSNFILYTMNYRDILYSLACLSFAVVIGGAIYEHLTVVPQWSAAPPKSLSMFQGTYRLKAEVFWKMIHPVTLGLFIAALAVSWKNTARKKHLLLSFTGYVIVLVITFAFFVPELIAITTTPYTDTIDTGLAARAFLWESLSLVRLSFLFVLSLVLFLGLTKREAID
jgi:hypothetical protein